MVAYQGDDHRLRECRLQSSQSRKLIANLELGAIDAGVHRSFLMGDRKTIELSNISTVWIFHGCSPSRNDTTPRHTRLIFCTLHTTLDSTVQWSYMKLDHWFYYNLQGKQWSKTARHTRPFKLQQTPNLCECTRSFIICNSNLHMSETSSTTCRAMQRERGMDREGPERRKMSEEESETKKVYEQQLPPRQEAISFLLRKGESCI